jgi:hypothetical protein
MVEARCVCGAVDLGLEPDFTYGLRDSGTPVMQWRGGLGGPGRVALEDALTGVEACPACQHRKCIFMISKDNGDSPRSS